MWNLAKQIKTPQAVNQQKKYKSLLVDITRLVSSCCRVELGKSFEFDERRPTLTSLITNDEIGYL